MKNIFYVEYRRNILNNRSCSYRIKSQHIGKTLSIICQSTKLKINLISKKVKFSVNKKITDFFTSILSVYQLIKSIVLFRIGTWVALGYYLFVEVNILVFYRPSNFLQSSHIFRNFIGNTCRSPMAECIMRHLVKEYELPWTCDSAGLRSWNVGRRPDERCLKVLDENGMTTAHYGRMVY